MMVSINVKWTHSGVEGGGVAGAGVIVTMALWISSAVDSNAGARGELVGRGAQHRVRRRSSRLQTTGQRAGGHQKLWQDKCKINLICPITLQLRKLQKGKFTFSKTSKIKSIFSSS